MNRGLSPLRLRLPVAVLLTALAGLAAPAAAQMGKDAPTVVVQPVAQPATQAAVAGVSKDLLTIYREALANDPSFASARFQAQASQERTPQARAGLLPSVGLSGSASINRDETSGYGANESLTRDAFGRPVGKAASGEGYRQAGATLTLTAPIYHPQSWETYGQAKLFVVQSEAQFAATRQDLIVRTANAYFGVLAARDQLTYLEAAKKATLEQLAQAKREFEVGTKTIIDTNEAQARYDQINAQEQVALGQLLVARSQLQSLIGHEPAALATLRDRPTLAAPQPVELTPWVKSAEDSNYSVQIARAGVEIAGRELQKSKDGHKPTVDLVAGYTYGHLDGQFPATAAFNNRRSNVGVQVNLPIYSGGLTQSRVRESLALDDKARADLEAARRAAANSARDSFTGVSYGLSQVSALESAELSAKTQLESTQLGYQVGVRIQLDVLNATTQLYSTQRDLKQARYNVLLSGLRLKATTAALVEDDLAAINALLQ